jgi:hypothetical protein
MDLHQPGQAHDPVEVRAGGHHEPNIPSQTPLQCCCGRLDCAYLKHNNAALEDLEKDLATAARLGQVSLHSFVSPAFIRRLLCAGSQCSPFVLYRLVNLIFWCP